MGMQKFKNGQIMLKNVQFLSTAEIPQNLLRQARANRNPLLILILPVIAIVQNRHQSKSQNLILLLPKEKRLPVVAVVLAVLEAVAEVEAEAKVVSEVLAVVAEVQSEVLALVQKEAEVKAEAEVPAVMRKKIRQKKRVKK